VELMEQQLQLNGNPGQNILIYTHGNPSQNLTDAIHILLEKGKNVTIMNSYRFPWNHGVIKTVGWDT